MEIQIRQFEPKDFETLRELNRQVFESDAKHIDDLDVDWPDSEFGKKYYEKVVNSDGATGFLAEIEGQPVGYAVVCIRNVQYRTKMYVEIENMGVAPEFRGKGIGTQLLHKAQEWARKQGVDRLLVSAFSQNEKALAFYREFGFENYAIDLQKDI